MREADVLIIEFIGFQNKEVSITKQSNYEIILDEHKKVCKKCERKKNREIKDIYELVIVFFLPNQIKNQLLGLKKNVEELTSFA